MSDTKPWEETWAAMADPVNGSAMLGIRLASGGVEAFAMVVPHDRARLAAAAPDLYRALSLVEWIQGECHICGRFQNDRHGDDCPIRNAFFKAEGIEGE